VRAAVVSDIQGLVESTAVLFAEDGAARDQLRNRKWPAEHGERWCADLLQNNDALVLVAVTDAGVVGHLIGFYRQASDMWVAPRAELVSMHVHGPHLSLGLGSCLVEAFKQWARGRGAARLQVTAYAANERAPAEVFSQRRRRFLTHVATGARPEAPPASPSQAPGLPAGRRWGTRCGSGRPG